MDTLYAGPDSFESTLAEFKPPLTDSTAPIAESPDNSSEIPETPVVAFKTIRREGNNYGEGGKTPSSSPRRWSTETDRSIGEDDDYIET